MNNKGFTLIEVMVAMGLLSFGILAVSNMQIQAIRGNQTANTLSGANSLAISLIEELKRIDFDDDLLKDNDSDGSAGLNDGKGSTPTPATADHEFVLADFPVFSDTYAVSGGDLVDNSNIKYQIFWNVDHSLPSWVPSTSPAPYCTIRLFVYWNSMFGLQHIEKTAFKYNNVKI